MGPPWGAFCQITLTSCCAVFSTDVGSRSTAVCRYGVRATRPYSWSPVRRGDLSGERSQIDRRVIRATRAEPCSRLELLSHCADYAAQYIFSSCSWLCSRPTQLQPASSSEQKLAAGEPINHEGLACHRQPATRHFGWLVHQKLIRYFQFCFPYSCPIWTVNHGIPRPGSDGILLTVWWRFFFIQTVRFLYDFSAVETETLHLKLRHHYAIGFLFIYCK